jgi:hypothetical protein
MFLDPEKSPERRSHFAISGRQVTTGNISPGHLRGFSRTLFILWGEMERLLSRDQQVIQCL